MRVAIDGASWQSRRGYGRFVRNVGARLATAGGSYVVYVDQESARMELPRGMERRLVRLRHSAHDAARAGSHRSLADILRMSAAVSRDRPDVFLFPSLHTYFPTVRVRTVVGIHDTIPEDFPELTYASRRERRYAALKRRLAMRGATRIFTVSAASRAALVARFDLDPRQLAVVPEAPDEIFSPRSEAQLTAALAPLGLRAGDFLVMAGGISPHKNLGRLVEAYGLLRSRGADPPPLVLVGDLEADPFLSSADELRELIARRSLQDRVLFPGYVPDETLACLYSGANAVVVPSLAEGFGLPAVEAAACGAAVVASDIPAHRETLDGAAEFVSPNDVEAIAQGIAAVLADDERRRRLGEDARTAVSRLSWDEAARVLWGVLEDAAHG